MELTEIPRLHVRFVLLEDDDDTIVRPSDPEEEGPSNAPESPIMTCRSSISVVGQTIITQYS